MRLHDDTVYRALKDLGFSLEHTRDQPWKITAIAGREGTIGQSIGGLVLDMKPLRQSVCNRYVPRAPVGPDLVWCSSTERLTLSDGGVAAASDATSAN
jgi:hypothetical protein